MNYNVIPMVPSEELSLAEAMANNEAAVVVTDSGKWADFASHRDSARFAPPTYCGNCRGWLGG